MIEYRSKYPNLIFIIIHDIIFNDRTSLILLCLILVSGLSVVIVTYKTRELITFNENIILEKDALEVENRHLMLEEKVLGDLSRIEDIALKKCNMKHINSSEKNEKNSIYFYN